VELRRKKLRRKEEASQGWCGQAFREAKLVVHRVSWS
jgi:hypothetical protein